MQTTTHTTRWDCITQVTPTMQALGDQPFRCQVFKNTRSSSVRETFLVEAGSRYDAARRAQELFDEKHGVEPFNITEIITPRRIA